jgi:hypothetical protein
MISTRADRNADLGIEQCTGLNMLMRSQPSLSVNANRYLGREDIYMIYSYNKRENEYSGTSDILYNPTHFLLCRSRQVPLYL